MTATAIMTARSLQDDFEGHVREMKSYVLALRLKSERQKCALWIRRLCEAPPGVAARRVRNAYSKALLGMLKCGRLDPPFRTTPSSGPLAPLPAHLAHYLESNGSADVPGWVADLSQDDGSRLLAHAFLDGGAKPPPYDTDADECAEIEAVLSAAGRFRPPSPAVRAPAAMRSPTRSSPPRGLSPAKVAVGARSPERPAAAGRLNGGGGGGRRSSRERSSGSCSDDVEAFAREAAPTTTTTSSLRSPSPSLSPSRQRQQQLLQLQQLLARRQPYRAGAGADPIDDTNGDDGDAVGGPESSSDGGGGAAEPLGRPASPRRADRSASDFSVDDAGLRSDAGGAAELRRSATSPFGGKPYRAYVSGRSLPSPPPSPAAEELDAKLKAFESRLRVETVQLHRKHDSAIQKTLQKKNGELEEMKARFMSKVREQEETIARLEKKVQTIVKDSALVRESKDQQIAELRRLADDSTDNRQNEFERRLHDLVAEHERDQFELQKQHTRVIQELTDEVTARIARIEADHKRQLGASEDAARQLEAKVHQMSAELDQLSRARGTFDQQKVELEAKLHEAHRLGDEYKGKVEALSAELESEAEEHRRAAEQARQKYDAQTNALRREHAVALGRAGEATADLEHRLAALQQSLSDAAAQAERRTAELEAAARSELAAAERRHENKVRSLNASAEQAAMEHRVVVQGLEERLRDRDTALQQQAEQLRMQALQNEAAVAEIRTQADKRVEQAQSHGRQRLAQAEENAESVKAAHEQQTKELHEQLARLRSEHDAELSSLRAQHEQDRQRLVERERQQREALVAAHAQEMERVTTSANADKAHLGEILRVTQEEYSSHAAELSDEITALREEIATNEKLRRQQLAELRQLHDEERQRLSREHDRDASRLRAEAERQRADLQRAHGSEMDCLAQNHESKIKQLEADYTVRLSKAAETAQELRALLEQVKAERQDLAERAESQLAESAAVFDEERRSMRQQLSAAVLALQGDIEAQRDSLRHAERRLREAEADHEERLLRATLDYEAKMKGLMPAAARQQLEDTIASLRSQVATLKQRVALLQGEQLESRRLQLAGRRPEDAAVSSFGASTGCGSSSSAAGAGREESASSSGGGGGDGDTSLYGSLNGSNATPPISV